MDTVSAQLLQKQCFLMDQMMDFSVHFLKLNTNKDVVETVQVASLVKGVVTHHKILLIWFIFV